MSLNPHNSGEKEKNAIVQLENTDSDFLNHLDLPPDDILAPIPERMAVYKNLSETIELIDKEQRRTSLYLSKFVSVFTAGLFDAALNYFWNETILQIRKRVIHYDLGYFYDNMSNSAKRKPLKVAEDIKYVSDFDLIQGATKIGLISDYGSKHLELPICSMFMISGFRKKFIVSKPFITIILVLIFI